MSDQPDPAADLDAMPVAAPRGAEATESSVPVASPAVEVVGSETSTVTVRRAPRYYRFMMVGLGVGLVITVVLVLSFPTQSDYSALQVIGFVGLFIVAICVGLGALVAIALDRASRKRARTVEAQRIEEHDPTAAE